nr:TonB-dependent receptor [uncultured Bacteroides sp.]
MKKVYVVFQRLNQISNLMKVACLGFFLMGSSTYVFAVPVGGGTVQTVQQSKTIMGVVVDESGEPIIGANIKVDGSTIGTITDLNGRFSLEVPAGGKVSVSYIGYIPQTLLPKQGKDFKIVLKEDSKQLDEVVVVGYGTQKAKNVTGSIGIITPKDIADLPVSNLGAALAGQVPGLSVSGGDSRPGEGANVSIRQQFLYSKDGGNRVPLVIIDDVIQIDPNSGLSTLDAFNALDPSEVESISVLRDASASIYGSRASQGAIIVKTKRGKAGVPKINYSGKFGFNDAVGHPKTLTGGDYGRFANSFNIANGKINMTDPKWVNNVYSDTEIAEMDNLNYDWLDEAWKPATSMNHSVNVSGGSDKATYFAGASYYTQGANMGKQDYDKWNFRAGVDVSLTSDLKFSATIAANQQNVQKTYTKGLTSINGYDKVRPGENGEYLLLSHMPTYQPWEVTLEDGNTYYTSPLISSYAASGNAKSSNKIGTWNYFAMENSQGSYSTDKDFGYDANFSISYAIPYVKGLSLKGSYALSRSASDGEQVFMPYTLAYLNKNQLSDGNRFFSAHPSLSDYLFQQFTGNTRVTYTDAISKHEQMNFYINYEKKIDRHSFTAMAAVEKMKSFQTAKQMIFSNPNPDSYLGTSPSAGTMDTSNSITYKYEQGALSYLGRFTYNYADKYLFQFMFRSDATTKFAPQNYWGFFPGVSVGWVASEENFFKKVAPNWFDYLKLRLSWGKTGKDNVKAWIWKQLYEIDLNKGYGFGTNGGTQPAGIKPRPSANADAHWDATNKYNLGLDLAFLNNRLSTTMDFYYDANSDILQSIGGMTGTPIFAGGGLAEVNFGRIDAWGSEFSINWRDKVGKVKYNVGVNFGFSDNKVKKWPDEPVALAAANSTREGASTIFPAWGFKVWKGNSTHDGILRNQADIDSYWSYLEANATSAGTVVEYLEKKNKSDLKPGMLAYQDLAGSINDDGTQKAPDGRILRTEDYAKLAKKDKTYGFTTKLGAEWKGLNFSMMLSTSWGGLRMIDVAQISNSSGDMVWSPDSFWKDMYDETNNPTGKYPNIGMENRLSGSVDSPSDFWTISTFRCYIRNMSVGYTLPKSWLAPLKIESAKLSLTGNNLWDLYNPYPDKYRNMYDATTTLYPTLRTWSLGVNVSF